MPTLAEIAGLQYNPDGTFQAIQPRLLEDDDEATPDRNSAMAAPPSGSPTLDQIASGHASLYDDGTYAFHDVPKPTAADQGDGGVWSTAYNTLLASGQGLGSGVEVAGALTQLVMPELGNSIRESGQDFQQYFTEKMDPEWQEAVNRSWLDLSSEGASRDWRSWVAGIASQIPYMIGTGGVGEVAALGIRGAATLAGKTAATTVGERAAKAEALKLASRKAGYMGAAGAAGAGESAAGAAHAADEAGLSNEQRQAAMWAAAPIGGATGVIIGPKLEKLLHGGAPAGTGVVGRATSLLKRGAQGATVEGIEEAGTQTGTEFGKATQGLDFDPGAILESAAGGAALGAGAGMVVSAPGARNLRERAAAARQGSAEAQAILNEANRLKDEEDLAKRNAVDAEQQRQQSAPLALPSPDTIPPTDQQPGIGATRTEQEQYPTTPLNPVQPPGVGPLVSGASATAQAASEGDQLAFRSPAAQENFNRLEGAVASIGAKLDEVRGQIAQAKDGAQRTKLTAQFRQLTKDFNDAQKARDAFVAQSRKFMGVGENRAQQLRLDGIMEEGTPSDINYEAIGNMDQQELNEELDKWFGKEGEQQPLAGFPEPEVENEERPLLKLLTSKLKRSQAAQKGHETRRANAMKSAQGPGQPIQQVVSDAPRQPAPVGNNAEMQALRGRTPSNNDQPSVPPVMEAALQPPPAAIVPPQPGQTEPGAEPSQPPAPSSNQSPAAPAAPPGGPAVAPEAAGQPAAPTAPVQPTVQPQRGGVTLPPSDTQRAPDETPTQGQMQYRDPTTVVGQDAPAPVAEPYQTKPRQKPLAKMTPRERLKKVLSAGPQPLDAMLAHMQDAFNNEKDTRAFRLIQKLRSAFPSLSRAAKTGEMGKGVIVEARKLSNGFQGLYDPRNNRIYLDVDRAEDLVTVFLHEAVHAGTLRKLRTNSSFRSDIMRYMSDMRIMWNRYVGEDPGDDAAFYDPEEFISRILTDFDFLDKLAALPAAEDIKDKTVWQRFRTRLSTSFGMRQDPQTSKLFDWMLELIPDGTFLQDGNREEVLTQLDNLGLGQPVASMMKDFRAMLRGVQANPRIAAGGSKRVWEGVLPIMGLNQIAESYGDLGKFYIDRSGRQQNLQDSINKYTKLNDIRDGYAEELRATADRIIGVGKQAAQESGSTKALDDVLMDARLWSLDADQPLYNTTGGPALFHPANAFGASLPGGVILYGQLKQRFDALTPVQKDFYRLVRDNSAAQRYDYINQVMIWRTNARAGKIAGKQLSNLIYQPARMITNANPTTGVGPSGVTINYNRNLSAAEVRVFVTGLGLSPAVTKRLYRDLLQVVNAIGKEPGGVYVPLRRTGNYYVMLRSPERRLAPMDRAAFDQMIADNKRQQGDIEILEENYDQATGLYSPKIRHITVTGVDTENEARELLADQKADWAQRGITIAPGGERMARKNENMYAALGLQSSSVDGLRRFLNEELSKTMGQGVGTAASDMALTYYLEKLPESSIRKSHLKARKIAGASRDIMHTYAQYANGAAYISAQLKYGADLSEMLNRRMTEDITSLTDDRQHEQANDLQIIQNFLKRRDAAYNRLAERQLTVPENLISRVWKFLPQLAGAWLLTGPGTILTNSLQVVQMGVPYFSARHGLAVSSGAVLKAYKDISGEITRETGREYGRFGRGLGAAAKVAVGRQQFTATIKDPARSIWEKATRGLPAGEQELIKQLAQRKKIDFGLTADIKSLGERTSGIPLAVQYLMDGAFILSQNVETMNRMVMGLASYRLNHTKVATEVGADQTIPASEKPAEIQRRLLDTAAEAIDRTQWNYSQANRPLAFQNEALRAALVFKTYPQNMWYTLVHNMLQSMHARTPEERRVARKFVAGMFATTAMAGGVMGILAFDPFYLAAVALTKGLTDEDDPEQALREALNEFLGDWTDLVLRGIPYGVGGPDTTNRLAFPAFFPVQEWVNPQSKPGDNTTAYERMAVAAGETLMGAPGSLIFQTIWPGAKAWWNGDAATMKEKLMPKSFGIADFYTAWNQANQGIADTKGNVFVGPKDLSYGDITARALGFDSAHVSEEKAVRRNFFKADDRLNADRSGLIAEFAEAQMARDRGARAEALKKIIAWNKETRKLGRGYVITRGSLTQSIRGRAKDDYLIANYGVRARTPGQRKLLDTIKERYGQ